MWNLTWINYIIIALSVSMFFFPFGFTFLPQELNSKNLCAMLGVIIAVWDGLAKREIAINRILLGAIFIVFIYSIIGYISIDINNTLDRSYANYFISFAVWTFGGYFAVWMIKKGHGTVNIRLITFYLAGIGLAQCLLAVMNNNIPAFKFLIDAYIDQGQVFLDRIGRWYGIGAALDPAGVRFSIILILIAGVSTTDESVKGNRKYLIFLLVSFFTMVLIGNIISRTTSVGALLGLSYIIINGGLFSLNIPIKSFKFYSTFFILIFVSVVLATYLYNSNEIFHDNLRYGFEGFFNWIETGEFSTDSTDKLNNEMWIWPESLKGWIIGTGYFDGWIYGTDIGYCRLILYNGMIGFTVFAFFFVYNGIVFSSIYRDYFLLFSYFICLTFIIWIKVSTDIYQIWAMFYALTMLEKPEKVFLSNIKIKTESNVSN